MLKVTDIVYITYIFSQCCKNVVLMLFADLVGCNLH